MPPRLRRHPPWGRWRLDPLDPSRAWLTGLAKVARAGRNQHARVMIRANEPLLTACLIIRCLSIPFVCQFFYQRSNFVNGYPRACVRLVRSCWQDSSVTMARQIRAQARTHLRNALLDAAEQVTINEGWKAVRMGAIAAQVGVSRQTLHNEFGTRDALGEVLVLREVRRVVAASLNEALPLAANPVVAIEAAIVMVLKRLRNNPLSQAIFTPSADHDEALLILLARHSSEMMGEAIDAACAFWLDLAPGLDQQRLRDAVDCIIRLTVVHALQPTEPPEVIARKITRVVLPSLVYKWPRTTEESSEKD